MKVFRSNGTRTDLSALPVRRCLCHRGQGRLIGGRKAMADVQSRLWTVSVRLFWWLSALSTDALCRRWGCRLCRCGDSTPRQIPAKHAAVSRHASVCGPGLS
jgi:hypothetical protein